MKLMNYIKSNPIVILLVFIPFAILAKLLAWSSLSIFVLSAISLIPLAGLIGQSTEKLSEYTGPKIGGLLNATLGNAAELIITLVAIKEGLLELVKASITGSIIGNLLLVMGVSMVAGGLKNGIQKFDRRQSSNQSILLILAVMALAIPSFFGNHLGDTGSNEVEIMSLGVAGVMVLLYALGIIYSLKANSDSPLSYEIESGEIVHERWSKGMVLGILAISTFGVVIMSEILVGEVDSVVSTLGLSEFFIGIIVIPIIGNIAEHLVAVQVAFRNKMDLSVEIAISSSLQIALFVAPILVFISLAMGNPLTLMFNSFELIALGSAVMIAALVAIDGESNWLEGAALVTIYLILGLSFFMLP
jgi:Ca2+:H+ antiporter